MVEGFVWEGVSEAAGRAVERSSARLRVKRGRQMRRGEEGGGERKEKGEGRRGERGEEGEGRSRSRSPIGVSGGDGIGDGLARVTGRVCGPTAIAAVERGLRAQLPKVTVCSMLGTTIPSHLGRPRLSPSLPSRCHYRSQIKWTAT